uniref:Uncharacterized protein n=1 Tax=Lepeophtheirus salmonis TaxID=72036 RepID=A0A0K2V156_LEPSM
MEKNVRSRTSSSSHPLSSSSSRIGLNSSSSLSPDQLSNIPRARSDSSQGSSIPTTPAPTPMLHVSHHMHPEQLAAGIKQLKVDEGYIDSTSLPGTPAPSPYSPSPAQVLGFSPDQIAEGIKRLREEGAMSGTSTGQPPTPSTTPGPAVHLPNQNWEVAVPERLLETMRRLHCDEGLESGSNPATPVPTPTTGSLRGQQVYFPPEQLAAGIHRLKVEEGMSSGGSSGFPSTPAPTPFSHLAGGVLPEDLAAGISRLSVIEEADSNTSGSINQDRPLVESENQSFDHKGGHYKSIESCNNLETVVLNSRKTSKINFPEMEISIEKEGNDTEIQIEQEYNIKEEFKDREQMKDIGSNMSNYSDEIERPTSLQTTSSNLSSLYATPTAATPVVDPLQQSMYPIFKKDAKPSMVINNYLPITSPIPNVLPNPSITSPLICLKSTLPEDSEVEEIDELWIPNQFTVDVLNNIAESSPGTYFPEKAALTMTNLLSKEDNKDPIKNMVTHFHGPSEAARRSHIPNVDTVSQDYEGLKLLIKSECYRSAVALTGRLLESMGQISHENNHFIKHTPASLQVWFIRLSLLVKLNLINKAEAESEPFQPDGDKPDLYYEFYPEDFPGRTGPMISFSFRLLLAQIPQFHGKTHETLDRLYFLWGKIKKVIFF